MTEDVCDFCKGVSSSSYVCVYCNGTGEWNQAAQAYVKNHILSHVIMILR
jgi:DnaJ-class molecular chaperone